MKKNFLLLFFLCSSFLQGQNLVPNPSFEDTVYCPDAAFEIDYCSGWSSYGGSSDYFNSCAGASIVGVPYNFGGYQPAASGNAYSGILTYVSPAIIGFSNYREYIGEMLSTNLIIGVKYYVSMKANCMNINSLCPSNCASNNLGVKFSNEPYNVSLHVINNPQINANTIITDTLNWTRIFGSFISDSTYQYIIIGNFFDYNNTDTLILNSDYLCSGAYYYIDDICVSTDSMYCANYTYTGINASNKPPYINIYPNPATNYLNIDFPIIETVHDIEIFNVLGQEVLTQKICVQNTKLDISNIPKGLLLIKISFTNQILFYKFFKQ